MVDYLERLDEIRGKKQKKEKGFRELYREQERHKPDKLYEVARTRATHSFLDEGPVETRAFARRVIEQAKKDKYLWGALQGAEIYGRLGKGKIGITKLMAVAERIQESGGEISDVEYRRVKDFIERNTGERQAGGGALEGKLPAFIALTAGGIALGIGSLTITGNAVSNLTQTTPGLLGIILFIAGLTGIFFYSRRK